MGSAFGNSAFAEHHDAVAVFYGGNSVAYENDCCLGEAVEQGIKQAGFSAGVDR